MEDWCWWTRRHSFRGQFVNIYCSKQNVTLSRGVKAKLECLQDCLRIMLPSTMCATLNAMQTPRYTHCSPSKKQVHRKTQKWKMFCCVLACNPILREYGQWASDYSSFDEAGVKELKEFRGRRTMHTHGCTQTHTGARTHADKHIERRERQIIMLLAKGWQNVQRVDLSACFVTQ